MRSAASSPRTPRAHRPRPVTLRGVPSLALPRNLAEAVTRDGDERRLAWLAALPETVEHFQQRWSLRVGEPFQPGGQTAWVAPARSEAGGDLVLKLAWCHEEARHESDGLRAWNGRGAVFVHAAEELDGTAALLLERCLPGSTLASLPEPEQDTVIASLLLRLWREPAAGHPLSSLQEMCDAWADGVRAQRSAARPMSLDSGLALKGIALFRALPAAADRNVLLCTDLDMPERTSCQPSANPGLMIDPKPYVGDPTYDALQHLLNCYERLWRQDPRTLVSRMADLLELDRERLLLWLFARCCPRSRPTRPALARLAAVASLRPDRRASADGSAARGRPARSRRQHPRDGAHRHGDGNDDGRT